jgi:F0F1-type ATP synthase membrane subunit c/vacuolar-type H+-ATPase subunit K
LAAASVGFAHLPALVNSSAWQLRGILALAAAALALVGLWKSDTIATVTAKLAAGTAERPRLLFTLMSLLTVMVVSVFFVDWVRQQEPPPVLYMAF